jgi:hypothetical protein
MEHDQRVIIRFLWNEQVNVHKMTHRFQAQLSEHAQTLRTIQFWITEAWLGCQDLFDEIRTRRPPLGNFDIKILAILHKSPFESARSISETLPVAHSTVLLHLQDSTGFRSFHLHWVPHLLMHDLREKPKECAKAILSFLDAAERDNWDHLVTIDES